VRLLLTGATGMVGGFVLRDALARREVTEIVSLGRRATGVTAPRLTEIEHHDFTDYRPCAAAFGNVGAALFCLGAYTGAVPDDELRRLTVDAVVAFATALHAASPGAAFCLLSGQGADPSGRSRIAFARYKGAAERAILDLGFPRAHLFRPGYIYPIEPRREPTALYRVMRALWPVARRLYPDLGIASDDLARAMVHAAIHGTGGHANRVLENRDVRELAKVGLDDEKR
jgi:uncharacterized protein YbjT (DUF2867 family)